MDAASLDLSGGDIAALERHFEVAPRTGSEADTLAALDALGMAAFTDGRTIDGATVTYTDWRAEQDGTTVAADTLTLQGVHQGPDGASFDALILDDLALADAATAVSAGELVVMRPDAELASDLLAVLRGDAGTPDEADIRSAGALGAVRMADVEVAVDEPDQQGTVSLGQLVFGQDDEAGTFDLLVDTVAMDLGAPEAEAAARNVLRMDGMTAIGVRAGEDEAGAGMLGLLGGGASMLVPGAEPPFRQVDVGTIEYRSSGLDLDFAGFEADSEGGGDVLTLRSVLQPMTLNLKDAAGTPLAPFYDALAGNGLAEFSLKGSQVSTFDRRADRVEVSESRFEIDEGLRMDCDYAVEGMQEAARALEASGVSAPDASNLQTDEDISRFIEQSEAYAQAQTDANGRLRIASLDCALQDVAGNSFVTRAYAAASDITGMPVAVLKGQAKTVIAMSSLTARDTFQRDLMDTLGSGLIDFLDTPGQTLRVTIAPDAPVPLSTFTGEDATLEPLNLSVSVD